MNTREVFMIHTLNIPIITAKKKYSYKIITTILALYLLILLIASCATAKSKDAYDLEVVTFYDSPAESEAFNAIINKFEKTTKLRVYAETIPREKYYASLEQYMSSDYPPDILAFHPGWYFRIYAAKNFFAPIETALPGKKFEKTFAACFKEISQYNSAIVFMPISWTWWALFYNKQAFSSAGIKVPVSYEELTAAAQSLRKAGIIPFTASAKEIETLSAWIALLLAASRTPELYTAFCSGTLPYTDSSIQSALQNLSILIKNKYVIDSVTLLTSEQALGPLISGKAALYLASAGIIEKLPKDVQTNIGVLPFPGEKNKSIIYADIEGLVIHTKAKHKANAEKFLAFMASQEAQRAMSLSFARVPANLTGKTDSTALEYAKNMTQSAATMVQTLEQMTPPNTANTIINEFKAIFSLPNNLQFFLQNLEAKRAELYKKK